MDGDTLQARSHYYANRQGNFQMKVNGERQQGEWKVDGLERRCDWHLFRVSRVFSQVEKTAPVFRGPHMTSATILCAN